MDVSTRIGLGGTALFTLVGLSSPFLGWSISGPIMATCAIVAAWGFWPLIARRRQIDSGVDESYPNVRAADSPAVIELFQGSERPKIIALLEAEKLIAWARVNASTSHDHVRLDGKIWNTHNFFFSPKSANSGSINETTLRLKAGTLISSYYDICFNYAQLKHAWPDLAIEQTRCDVL